MNRILSMAALVATAVPLGLGKAKPAGGENGMEISPEQSRPATPGPAENFTGAVSVKPLFGPNHVRASSAAEVTFTPCARTAWHTHPGGQTLIVTSGTGWVQQRGGPKQQIHPGDVIWTPPNVMHWHGANAAGSMTHMAIQDIVDGRAVDWAEHVTDDEYQG